jgi:hypothetical protein
VYKRDNNEKLDLQKLIDDKAMLIDIGFYDGINLTVSTDSKTLFGGYSNI